MKATAKKARAAAQIEAPREVRVRPHTYQPTKAEIEAPVEIRKPDGTRPTVDEFVAAVFRPVRIVPDPDA